ncbi:MAG TPA: AAA family ATPase [Candidatus Binataceae bacterium]
MADNTPSAEPFLSPGASQTGTAQKGVFRKAAGYWTVGYGESASRLKDTRGLWYLAYLLRHPHTEFHALDLFGGIAGQREEEESSQAIQSLPERPDDLEKAGIHISGPSDAGEMLDEQAKAAYRSRVSELHEELEEAKRLGKVDRAEQVEEEIDALTRELSRAVGLAGRNRRAASASERARQSVTKSIKSTLERIAQIEATVGDHLMRCIKTGNFCAYRPDPGSSFAWEFAETLAESTETPTPKSDPLAVQTVAEPEAPVVLDTSPFPLAERTGFVGRDAERAAIRAIVDGALSGRGSVVMLAGGPGVGKSRLALEMMDYASRVGFRCNVGHCYERDEPFPYLPFVEIIESELAQAASLDDFRRRMGDNAAELAQLAPRLRRFFPDIPQPQDLLPSQKRRYIFQSISEVLMRGARTRSYLSVLEDLHWADESTLALLIHLASRVTQLPVVLIGTYRDLYLDSSPALVRTLEELIRMGIRPIKLEGLSKDAVAQMLNGLSKREAPQSLVSLFFDETQGNPFFVEELYRHMLEENKVLDVDGQLRRDITVDEIGVPENVRLVIGRRIERLDENEKRVLATAAVIGRSFSFQLLVEISGIDMDELFAVIEKAQQMGIIVASAEGPERPLTFGHELVRQTLLGGISTPREQQLHLGVADAIERLHPRAMGEHAGDIADHLIKAGPLANERRLVHYLTLAGKGAIEAAAFEAALRSFRSALSHLKDEDVEQRADLLMGVAIAERGLEQWEAGYAHLGEAFEIYVSLGDRKKIAKCGAELTTLFVWGGRFRDATEIVHRALDCFGAEVSAERARLLSVLGSIEGASANWEASATAHEEALSIASELSNPTLVARVFGERSIVNYEFLRLRQAADDAAHSCGSETTLWVRAIELQVLYQTLLLLGRMEGAAKVRDQAEALATRIGQSYSIARILIAKAWVEFGASADLSKFASTLEEVFNSEPRVPSMFWDVFANAQLSFVNFFRGDWSKALSHAQASYTAREDTFIRGFAAGTFFRQMAYAGDRDGALAILDQKRDWLPRRGQPNTMGSWWMLVLATEGLAVLGEKQHAARLYPLLCELADTGAVVLWPIFRFTQTVLAIAAAAAGRWQTAETHFQTALRQAETIPHLLEQAEIHRFHAMMLTDRGAPGDRGRAHTLLEQALESYRRIGMPRHIDLVQALLK